MYNWATKWVHMYLYLNSCFPPCICCCATRGHWPIVCAFLNEWPTHSLRCWPHAPICNLWMSRVASSSRAVSASELLRSRWSRCSWRHCELWRVGSVNDFLDNIFFAMQPSLYWVQFTQPVSCKISRPYIHACTRTYFMVFQQDFCVKEGGAIVRVAGL